MKKEWDLLLKLTPELSHIAEKRYEILANISFYQPIGRRALAELMELKERELRNEINVLKNEVEKTEQEVNTLKDDLHKIELRITRLKNKKSKNADRLKENYNFNPEKDIPEDRMNIKDYSALNKQINKLKTKIDKLGIVNQGAIKEHENLQEKVKNLKHQQQDLKQARKSINKVIKKIEKTMGDEFYRTFVKVKEEFEKIFIDLFSGGQAELKLTEPDNYLESGIEINAQPPGKQLKKLSLLSGGERALTAIALVFAFLKVNPSPVYILDEIDAPLDDANLVRFSQFIEKYSKLSQFIIITHRKHMMTKAHTIYGISMEESGVSKLISLKLNKENELKFKENYQEG